jgi:hypothetical protein
LEPMGAEGGLWGGNREVRESKSLEDAQNPHLVDPERPSRQIMVHFKQALSKALRTRFKLDSFSLAYFSIRMALTKARSDADSVP